MMLYIIADISDDDGYVQDQVVVKDIENRQDALKMAKGLTVSFKNIRIVEVVEWIGDGNYHYLPLNVKCKKCGCTTAEENERCWNCGNIMAITTDADPNNKKVTFQRVGDCQFYSKDGECCNDNSEYVVCNRDKNADRPYHCPLLKM